MTRYIKICLILIFVVCKKEEIKKIEGTLAWKTHVSNWMLYGRGIQVWASPAIGPDGTIYVEGSILEDTTHDYYLYALKPDGTIKWRAYTFDCYSVSSITIGQDGTLYVGCINGLMAFYPNGAVKWKEGDIEVCYEYFPALASDGTLYIFNDCDQLYAVNSDGTKKWKINLTRWNDSISVFTSSSLVIGSDGIVYFVGGGYVGKKEGTFLFALNPNRTIKWIYLIEEEWSDFSSIAIDSQGIIYVGTEDGVYVINPDGTLKWKTERIEFVYSLIIGKDALYLTDGEVIYALSLEDGNVKWEAEIPDPMELISLVLSSDGTIYVSSYAWDEASGYPYKYNGYLYAFSLKGELKWKFKPDGGIWVAPTIGQDGTVYFNSTDGYFYAVNGSGKLANSPWPKYQCDLRNTGRVK